MFWAVSLLALVLGYWTSFPWAIQVCVVGVGILFFLMSGVCF